MRQELQAAGVKVISPQEILFRKEDKRAVVVDVRPADDYEEGHIPGAANVPFYQPITGWTPFKVARRIGYAAFGILKGTEVNPNFVTDVQQLLEGDQELILYCSQGGVLEPNDNYRKGWQTRSMVAAYELLQAGVGNSISVLRGGYTEWCNGGRDIEVMELVESTETEQVQAHQ
eukprot:gene4642-4894_t